MYIRELTKDEFEKYRKQNPLGNHFQTFSYAELMKYNGYQTEFIGLVDHEEKVHAASLILIKKISRIFKYGYAPTGFILDYTNKKLLKTFTEELLEYYQKKRMIFIKINPEIAVAEIDSKTYKKEYNWNIEIKNYLIDLGYVKLKDNLYFESKIPRYNGIVNMKNYSLKTLNKNTRNKINRAASKGLKFEKAKKEDIDILYSFVKRKKKKKDILFYKKYYEIFNKTKNIELFLVSINTNEFLVNSKNLYEQELNNNAEFASKLMGQKSEKKLNKKMNSDQKLLSYKNDVLDAQNKLKKGKKIYIAGALVMKYNNRVSIIMSGYDINYKRFNPNYFLHFGLLEYYKKDYTFLDLNGMTGDFSNDNPYKGLNRFKLGFNPKIYEFIGEYDLPIKPFIYRYMLKSGRLAKKFNKKDIKLPNEKKEIPFN